MHLKSKVIRYPILDFTKLIVFLLLETCNDSLFWFFSLQNILMHASTALVLISANTGGNKMSKGLFNKSSF